MQEVRRRSGSTETVVFRIFIFEGTEVGESL
jgi:hypothetical protein